MVALAAHTELSGDKHGLQLQQQSAGDPMKLWAPRLVGPATADIDVAAFRPQKVTISTMPIQQVADPPPGLASAATDHACHDFDLPPGLEPVEKPALDKKARSSTVLALEVAELARQNALLRGKVNYMYSLHNHQSAKIQAATFNAPPGVWTGLSSQLNLQVGDTDDKCDVCSVISASTAASTEDALEITAESTLAEDFAESTNEQINH